MATIFIGKVCAAHWGDRPASKHRPATSIYGCRHLPKAHWDTPLTCVPSAYDTALRCLGIALTPGYHAAAKRAESNGMKSTDAFIYGKKLQAEIELDNWPARFDRVVLYDAEAKDGATTNLRTVVKRMKANRVSAAVLSLKTPCHAIAVHLDGDTVQVLDNGGWRGWNKWQGANIWLAVGIRRR